MAKDSSTIDKLLAEFKFNSNSYRTFNSNKIQDSLAEFTQKQREAFLLIPYMLQTNSPSKISIIPSKRKAPAGIVNFKWGQDVEPLLRKYFGPNASFDRKDTDKQPLIEFVSTFGSVGSIVHNDQSNFNYWCCISNTMSEIDKGYLQEKLINIERWCESKLKVGIHFFITNQKSLASNDFGKIPKEPWGSAVGKLLKEEYYRSSILVAGKIPYWYIIPVGYNDKAYLKLVDFLDNRNEYHSDFIDIGNIDKIPNEEIIVGGLIQLNKQVDHPFESLLQMSLLVVYSNIKITKPLLANQLKKLIQSNSNRLENWDPYTNMIDLMINYISVFDPEHVELLKQSFFMKIGKEVSSWYDSKEKPPLKSQQVILEYCKKWGWDKKTVEKWERFENFSTAESLSFKHQADLYMVDSLKTLHERVDDNRVINHISEEGLNGLINRLLVFYDNSRDGAESYGTPFKTSLQSNIYTMRSYRNQGFELWKVYKGEYDVSNSLEEKSFIREDKSLSNIILWMIYNGLIDHKTKIHTPLQNSNQFSYNLNILAYQFGEFYGSRTVPDLNDKAFILQPKPIKWVICINPYPQLNESKGLPSDFEEDIETPRERPLFPENKTPFEKTKKIETLDNDTSVSRVLRQFKEKVTEREEPTIVDTEVVGFDINERDSMKMFPPTEDPLNAWSHSECLLRDCIVFEQNSWGEITAHEYDGSDWIVELCVHILNNIKSDFENTSKIVDICMGQDFYDPNRFKSRIKKLMTEMLDFFFPNGKVKIYERVNIKIFIVEVHEVCYCISQDENEYNWFNASDYQKVFMNNSLTYQNNILYHFDKGCSLGRFYQKSVESSQNNRVDIFFQKTNKRVNYITVDRNGKLFVSESSREEMRLYFPKFVYSINLCMKRVEHLHKEKFNTKDNNAISIAWYKRDKEVEQMVNITKDTMSIVPKAVKRLKGIEIVLEWSEYKCFVNHYIKNGEFKFSNKEGEAVFDALVENLRVLRESSRNKNRDHYPIILTDIQMKSNPDQDYPTNTSIWLNVKHTIEMAIAHKLGLNIE